MIIKLKNFIIKLYIYDTAGTELYQSISTNYYRRSFASLIVFDLCKEENLKELENWINYYKENRDNNKIELIYLIGNKVDLDNREIQEEDISDLMKKNKIKNYYEVSAKTGKNVDELFKRVLQDLIQFYLIDGGYEKLININIVLQ